jgi:hypothetical protein
MQVRKYGPVEDIAPFWRNFAEASIKQPKSVGRHLQTGMVFVVDFYLNRNLFVAVVL